MGASASSNTARSIAEVANSVQQSTTVTQSQVNSIQQNMSWDNCYLNMSGDYDIKTSSTMVAKAKQMVTALQQSQIQNDIAQQMLQKATSTTGALPMGGFAFANNYASQFVSATNEVINSLSAISNQYNYVDQNWSCHDSTFIGKNFLLSQNSGADFFSDQVVNNQQITHLSNDITQSITQKATATVQGVGVFLLFFALIIAACGYGIAKPLSSGGMKIVIISLLVVGVGILIAIAFLYQWPPFFQQPDICTLAQIGGGVGNGCSGSGDQTQCIKTNVKTIPALWPPLQYIYPLFDVTKGQKMPPTGGSLLGMYIARNAQSAQYPANGGLNAANAWNMNHDLTQFINRIQGRDIKIPSTKIDPTDPTKRTPTTTLLDDILSDLPELMLVPVSSGSNYLYEIPTPFLPPIPPDTCAGQSKTDCCRGTCLPGIFSILGTIIPVSSPSSSNNSPQPSSCSSEIKPPVPLSSDNKACAVIEPKNGGSIWYGCPYKNDGSKSKVGCGCRIGEASDNYFPLKTSTLTAENYRKLDSVTGVTQYSSLLAEENGNALKVWCEKPPTMPPNIQLPFGWKFRFIRSWLANELELGTHFYIEPSDLAFDISQGWNTVSNIQKNSDMNLYQIIGDQSQDPGKAAQTGYIYPVSINGEFGICNNNLYKFNTFVGKIGVFIIIGLIIITILSMVVHHGINLSHNYDGKEYMSRPE